MTHWKFVFYLHLTQLRTTNFQFLQSGCVSKNEKNLCFSCCCYSVPPPRIRQISRSYFLKQNLEIFQFLHCLSLKYVVSDHFRWSNDPVNQNKLRMCLHFHQILTWHRCLKLSALFGLCIYVRSLKTVPSGKQWLKSFLRDHWPFTTVQSR